jgi:secondary thiamine-phosphate synthase enzyme
MVPERRRSALRPQLPLICSGRASLSFSDTRGAPLRPAQGQDARNSTMKQAQTELAIATRGRGFQTVTAPIVEWIERQRLTTGLLTVFIRHTSASLLIQENADPDVLGDFERFFGRLVPDGDPLFVHRSEGPDDMPAHVRAALTQTQVSIPIAGGRLALGAWQGIYLVEHRHAPHRRTLVLHAIGE